MDRKDLIVTLREAMLAIWKKWGEVKTPFGSVRLLRNDVAWTHPIAWEKTIYISTDYPNSHDGLQQTTLDELFSLQEKIAAMAQFLASEDFIKKVDNSVAILKKIAKALE